jgi:hypothetical protein
MNRNRYALKGGREKPDYTKIEGTNACSVINSGMDLDCFMPIGPGRYCLYKLDYGDYWMVGRIPEFSTLPYTTPGMCVEIPVESSSGCLLMLKPFNIRGILTDKGLERIHRYTDTRIYRK